VVVTMTESHDLNGDERPIGIDPGPFCRLLLKALEAAESQTRRRKRDQAPDRLGLAVKRDLLEHAADAAPAPDAFEGWLVARIAEEPAAGPVRAMCEQIFLEYRMARFQPELVDWLARGAPSDDTEPTAPGVDVSRPERPHKGRDRPDGAARPDRWHGTDEAAFACTCHLPQH
jgi:hypothetical protein